MSQRARNAVEFIHCRSRSVLVLYKMISEYTGSLDLAYIIGTFKSTSGHANGVTPYDHIPPAG